MIFTKNIELKSKCTVEELILLIQEHTDKPTTLTKLFSGNRKRLHGKIESNSFKLKLNHWNTNSVSPVIQGSISNDELITIIKIKYLAPTVGIIFSLLISMVFIISSVSFGDEIEYGLLLAGLGFIITMKIGFDLMCNMTTEFLEREFRAKKIR